MGKPSSSDKNGLKKGPWTAEEDEKLMDYIRKHGYGRWRTLPKNAGLQRCGKSCRLRWTNYLRPDIKRGKFTNEEEDTIIQLHSVLGNKWSAIAARLPGRTDNEIKNYWNTNIKKKLLRMGIDPLTHKPRLDLIQLFTAVNSLFKDQLNFHGTGPTQSPTILSLAASILSAQHQLDGTQVQDQFPELKQVNGQAQLYSNPPNFSYQNCDLVQDFANYGSENNIQAIMTTPLENLPDLSFGSLLSTMSSVDTRLIGSSSTSTSTTRCNGNHNDDETERYSFSDMVMQSDVPNKVDIANNGFM